MLKKVSLIIFAAALVGSPFWLPMIIDAQGTDDQATSLIGNIDKEYTPWADSLIELPSDVAEASMFAIQIVLGLGLLFWGLRKLKSMSVHNQK